MRLMPVDAALPFLSEALDAPAMGGLFEQHLRKRNGTGIEVIACEIERVKYTRSGTAFSAIHSSYATPWVSASNDCVLESTRRTTQRRATKKRCLRRASPPWILLR